MTQKNRLTVWHHDDDFDKKKLKEVAKKYGYSMSQLIVQLIKSFLENEKEGRKEKGK